MSGIADRNGTVTGTSNGGFDVNAENGVNMQDHSDIKFTALELDGDPGKHEKVGNGAYAPVTHAVAGGAEPRDRWGRKAEFVLACVGYAVGLGNVWRFPYLCFSSGGGAFLIPYFIMLILCGIPLLVMEFGLGQYVRAGPVKAFKLICPIFKGTGLATVMISFILTTYYNVIIAWALFYLIASMQSELPWDSCNNTWNTDDCFSHQDYMSLNGSTKPNNTVSPTEEYFHNRVLQITDRIDDTGSMRWELFALLLVSWIIVYLCLFKGLKTSGKVVYFTATFPYLVLLVLFINGIMLDGAIDGIKFLFQPKWEQVLDVNVWVAAAAQNFNSIGIAFGSMIAFSSYNGFHSKTIFRDTFSITVTNSLTSLFAAVTIFSALGFIAKIQGQNVEDVITQGPGLVFVVYPAVFSTMPVSQLWSVLFFIMLFCLGIDSQFAMVKVVITTFLDGFPKLRFLYFNKREVLVAYICFVSFLLGLPHITQGGMYVFQLLDWYNAIVSLFFIAIFEVTSVAWFYGAKRLARNMKEMTGSAPNFILIVCWVALSPALILVIMVFQFLGYKSVSYGDYTYPGWALAIGWCVAFISFSCIPIGIIHTLLQSKGNSFKERIMMSFRSPIDEATHGLQFQEPSNASDFPPSYEVAVQSEKL
ncbi:sodium- and chloride-dependent GABA transporter ine-like isoform X1 [Asterias rubens]|uniref:sodium- and chloride-dependent GABA transporter ine-like isoform X1 n=2 Tax=Asterias rubens TaxID=7604 RepID=UPI001455DB3C|nr:sodium- and chloride-dependent GABA transporter ine-like isoform X1 [Asterias rubens]